MALPGPSIINSSFKHKLCTHSSVKCLCEASCILSPAYDIKSGDEQHHLPHTLHSRLDTLYEESLKGFHQYVTTQIIRSCSESRKILISTWFGIHTPFGSSNILMLHEKLISAALFSLQCYCTAVITGQIKVTTSRYVCGKLIEINSGCPPEGVPT